MSRRSTARVGQVVVKLLGVRQVRQLMKRMDKGARAGLRAGVRKALTTLAKAIRREIPASAKGIRKSIGSKVKVSKSKGVEAKVGTNVGKKKGKGHVPHASVYVLGSGERVQTKTGRPTGKMPANPVVKTGIAKSEKQAIAEMKKKIRESLRKARKR
jgi:hypothetical protein